MTVRKGFKELMYEEMAARGIDLTDEENRDYRKAMKRFKHEVGSTKSLNPVVEYARFKWW